VTTISVTAAHIARGVRDDCENCPVALAIRDAIPDVKLVAVDGNRATFAGRYDWIDIELPLAVGEFIGNFDDGGTVGPFSFDLDYPAVTP
jgi:hypothetical protein